MNCIAGKVFWSQNLQNSITAWNCVFEAELETMRRLCTGIVLLFLFMTPMGALELPTEEPATEEVVSQEILQEDVPAGEVAAVGAVSEAAPVPERVAGGAPRQVLRTHSPIRELAWDGSDTLISFLERDSVHLVDGESHAPVGSVEFPGVLDYSLFMEEDGTVHIIAGSADGTVAVWDIPYRPSESLRPAREFEPHFMNSVGGGGVDLLAFSDDSNYIAGLSAGAGEIGIHYKLRYTNELISKRAAGTVSGVYSMAFSDDDNQLAAATRDGRLLVWNAFNGRFMYEHGIYAQGGVPVHFIQGTYNLLVATAERTVAVLDPTGTVLQQIATGSPVVDTRMLSDRRRLAVLTADNRIEIYNLEDGLYLGYVPSFNVTRITSFDFNSTDTSMVVGHGDGSIYKIDLETNVLAPRTGPVLRLIGEEEVVAEGEEFTERVPPARYSDMEAEEGGLDGAGLFPAPWHSADVLVGTTFLPDPFTQSVDLQLGYTNGFLLHPFCFGLLWRSSWGFPQKDFPYIYHRGQERHEPPLLVSWVLELPVGLSFAPWDFGFEIHMEVAVGFAMHELWNRRLGNLAVTAGLNSGDFHGAFVTALTLGASWKGVVLKVSGEWDSEFGWTGQIALGYSFGLPVPERWRGKGTGGAEMPAGGEAPAPAADAEGGGPPHAEMAEVEAFGGGSIGEEDVP